MFEAYIILFDAKHNVRIDVHRQHITQRYVVSWNAALWNTNNIVLCPVHKMENSNFYTFLVDDEKESKKKKKTEKEQGNTFLYGHMERVK